MNNELNAREQLSDAADWLGWQHEDLSAGLRSPEDGIKLWRYWQSMPVKLPEMADEEITEDCVESAQKHRVLALGYDPIAEYHAKCARGD